jgi:sugar lactone lactonase YvrE
VRFRGEREGFKPGVLEFPGKVLADASRRRLFISDTNHHRVLVADLEGRVQEVYGTGRPALIDGPADKAQFHQPQGLALSEDGNTLYVADTENHALRGIDLPKKTVATLAGTGRQSQNRSARGPGLRTALTSPWDLARVDDRLYIAMAGIHQIWLYDLKSRTVSVWAGTGNEAGTDGPLRSAAFAQPSGLATDGRRLYVADSEDSSIRVVELAGSPAVRTLAGSGELFGFGREDGTGRLARFQHPLGVALAGNRLFVADTFNHLIRAIDLGTGEVTTWLGSGRPGPGTADAPGLFEPGGLSLAGNTLYVADTNNHRILVVDILTRKARVLGVRLPGGAPAGN